VIDRDPASGDLYDGYKDDEEDEYYSDEDGEGEEEVYDGEDEYEDFDE